jgi:hypothetical protein
MGAVCSLWGAGSLVISGQSAAAAPSLHTFDSDSDGNGVADCWFVNRWGSQSSSSWVTTGRTGRAQVLSGSWFSTGASLRLAQEGRCTLPVSGGELVRAGAWYQASGPAEAWVEARTSTTTWRMVGRAVLGRTSGWTRLNPPAVPMPAGTVAARIQFRLTGPGRLTLDDLSVERVVSAATSPSPSPSPSSSPSTSTPPPVTVAPVLTTAPTALLAPAFPATNALVTNEYAYYNPTATNAVRSPDWRVTSGSLFSRDSTGWSGIPDDREPNATSSTGTNSAIFRAITPKLSTADAVVRTRLRINRMTSTASTPQVAWDGVHLFLRYQSEYSLYYASVARRDGHVVLKKKCVGGSSNGGTYYTLAERSGFGVPLGTWMDVGATVKNNADGSVNLTLQRGGQTILSAVDRGVGCSAIRGAGSLGLRGDNSDFQFAGFQATSS